MHELDGPLRTVEHSAQTQEELGSDPAYLLHPRDRLNDSRFLQASEVARGLEPEQQESYKQRVELVAREFTESLGIEAAFFAQPKNREVFASLCDCWVAAHDGEHLDDESRAAEKKFLSQFARVLAGKDSAFNRGQAAQGVEGARNYCRDEVEQVQELEHFDKLLDLMKPEKSVQLAELFSYDGAMLSDTRRRLGVTSENEVPYQILVVDAKVGYGSEDLPDLSGAFGMDGAAFKTVDPRSGVPTIVIPVRCADEAMDNDDEYKKRYARGLIAHEYAHTQRSFHLGDNSYLASFWDEAMVIGASRSGGHTGAMFVRKMISDLLPRGEFSQSFVAAWKSEDAQGDFLQFIANNFGHKAALRLLATQPISYGPVKGIDEVPGVRDDTEYRLGDLAQFVVNERQKIDPEAVNQYVSSLQALTPEDAKIIRIISRTERVPLPTVQTEAGPVSFEEIVATRINAGREAEV